MAKRKAKKKKNYTWYAADFKRIVENQVPIVGCKYDTEVSEIIENAADFRQVYKKGDKAREQLPKYWFYSKEGFMVSMLNKEEPKWVKPNLAPNRPVFSTWINGEYKNITTYALTALVWDSYISPNAKAILDEQGVLGLGSFEIEEGTNQHIARVQGHHKDGYRKEKTLENYIINNDPTKVQLVTVREHDALNKMQQGKMNPDIHYQSSFINVPHDKIVAYLADGSGMIDLEKEKPYEIGKVYQDFREEDSIKTEKFIFVSKDNREFLEENKEILTVYAQIHPPKPTKIKNNCIPDFKGHEVYYHYLSDYQNYSLS